MIAYLPKEKLEFEIREGVKDDKDVLWEMFGENIYRLDEARLGENKVVLDIGANIGAFSIKAAAMVEGVHVIAVEPEPNNLRLLTANIKRNNMKDLIKVYALAVSAPGISMMEITDGAGSSVATPSLNVAINTISLKNLIVGIERDYGYKEFDFLKVDVEGSEYDIFHLASPDLINKFKYIALEFHPISIEYFGHLVATLTRTHTVDIIGSYEKGGNIYANRY